MNRRFEIQPRAAELGGGGVFPPQPEQGIGEDWLAAFVENQA